MGTKVSLECVGEGDPIPTVQWRYDRPPERGDIPTSIESDPSQGSATLTINSVGRTDSGSYYCTAKNDGGSVTEIVQVIGKLGIYLSLRQVDRPIFRGVIALVDF
jgi:hypothetical protein